jgi:hypothetical protein
MCQSEAGTVRHITDDNLIPTGTVADLPDYQWGVDSGWIHWHCDKCHATFWTLATPGGPIQCLCCEATDTVPNDAIVLLYEGSDGEEDEDD